MKKRSQRFLATIGALLMAGAFVMTGCGSSGGGSSDSTTGGVTYSGTTTQATLDDISGANISTAATESISSLATTSSDYGISPSFMKGASVIQPLAFATSIMKSASPQAPTTTTGTCPTNPGSMESSMTVPDGVYDYSTVYNQYCVGTATDYYITNGSITLTGTKDNYTVTLDKLTINFVYSSYNVSGTAEMGGKMTVATSGDVTTATINHAVNISGSGITVNSVSSSFKFENFVIENTTTSATTLTTKYTGRFYYGTYGYVDITTPTLLSGTTGTDGYVDMYTAGTIRFAGSGGNYYEITYQADGTTTGSLNGTGTSTDFPTCESGKIAITGTADGYDINLTTAFNSYSFQQYQTPYTYDVSFDSGTLHLQWDSIIYSGQTNAVDVTGSIIYPENVVNAGKEYCAGTGSNLLQVDSTSAGYSNSDYKISLSNLSVGPDCQTTVSGSLKICVRSSFLISQ